MQMVINIYEEDFEEICMQARMVEDTGTLFGRIRKAIFHSTPLPKGHGRIGDLDALREEVYSWGMNDYEPSDFIDAIDDAPTIVEADEVEE